jgi:hypothetical protein
VVEAADIELMESRRVRTGELAEGGDAEAAPDMMLVYGLWIEGEDVGEFEVGSGVVESKVDKQQQNNRQLQGPGSPGLIPCDVCPLSS